MTDTSVYNPTRPKVAKAALAELLAKGSPLLIGEFRGFKVDKVEYVDKQTGKPASFLKCEMNIEVGNGTAIPCEVRLPRGLDNPEKISLGVTKGQQVVLRLASLTEAKGRTFASVGAEPEAVAILA